MSDTLICVLDISIAVAVWVFFAVMIWRTR